MIKSSMDFHAFTGAERLIFQSEKTGKYAEKRLVFYERYLTAMPNLATLAQHSTAQHSTAQHSTAQHSTAQHSTAQHSTAQANCVFFASCGSGALETEYYIRDG